MHKYLKVSFLVHFFFGFSLEFLYTNFMSICYGLFMAFKLWKISNIPRDASGGFAMLIFVVITAMSLLFMMIGYAEKQRQIGDNVREIIKSERALQSAFLCAGQVSNTLVRYPLLNDDLISNIKNISMSESGDENYWASKTGYSNYNQKGSEGYVCSVISFNSCPGGVNGGITNTGTANGAGDCSYNATIEGYNTFNNVDENNHSKIYIEWKLDEYRLYIKSLAIL